VSFVDAEPGAEPTGRYERDRLLLQRYVATRSEEAFAALFERYYRFVYAVCLREVRNPELAADAAQVVFIALTQKAATIQRGASLSAWLFQAARLAGRDLARRERCRANREQSAVEEQVRDLNGQSADWEEQAWRRIDPCLNEALARLSGKERLAVCLRYFDGLSMAECGHALGLSPDAARMRIHRALEKMRRYLGSAGATVGAAALAVLLARECEAAISALTPMPPLPISGAGPHAAAVKGVVFKMNLLVWKPVIAGLAGAGAALSLPILAPIANYGPHHAPRGAIAQSALILSPQPAPVDDIHGFALDGIARFPGSQLEGKPAALAMLAGQTYAPRQFRTAVPPARGPAVTGPQRIGSAGSFAIRYAVPIEQLSPEARMLIKRLAAQTVDEDRSARTKQILTALRGVQKGYTSEGQLDEAVAVRQAIRVFKQRLAGILPDPGNLTAYRGKIGSSYLFSVVGKTTVDNSSLMYDLYLLRGARIPEATSQRIDAEVEQLYAGERSSLLDLGSGVGQAIRSLPLMDGSLDTGSVVPAGGTATVWGTDIYTDDSPLAAVAVHAGVLKEGETGIVRVTIFAGKDEYDGSTRNGVTSTPYGPWEGSYMVEKAPPIDAAPPATLPAEASRLLAKLGPPDQATDEAMDGALAGLRSLKTDAQKANKLDEALLIRDTIAAAIAAHLDAMPDPGNLTEFRGHFGRPLFFQITGRTGGSIWGSETYTDDTDIGTAAVHAGLLKPGQTGVLQVTILPGMQSYAASTRNGVTSSPYAAWTGSYQMRVVTTY